MVDMQVIVRLQDRRHCASITCMIRHYVARRAKVIFDHPQCATRRCCYRMEVKDRHRLAVAAAG
jgi:hypothetical protein